MWEGERTREPSSRDQRLLPKMPIRRLALPEMTARGYALPAIAHRSVMAGSAGGGKYLQSVRRRAYGIACNLLDFGLARALRWRHWRRPVPWRVAAE